MINQISNAPERKDMKLATDLCENAPDSIPGSFMKPSTTIIGHGEALP